MKYAIITDTHFGARGDSVPMMNNQQKFFENIFFPTLREHGIKRVYHGGDYTDRRKYVNYATAQWIQQHYRQPMLDEDIYEMVLVGNHDCYLKHSTAINSIEELYRYSDMVTVVSDPVQYDADLVLLPWICDSNRDASLRLIENTKASLVLGHLEIKGFQMFRGMPSVDGLQASIFDKFSLVMSGHFHHKSQDGPIHYLGAPYPMTWGDYEDPRGFHLFDDQTHELTFIENPYSLFNRLLYDDTDQSKDYITGLLDRVNSADSPYREAYVKIVVKAKTQPGWFDQLLDALYAVNVLDIKIMDDIVVSEDDDIAFDEAAQVDTVALMNDYVDTLEINCDKPALTTYLRGLYQEAVALGGQ